MRYLFCVTGYGESGKDTFVKALTGLINITVIPTYSDRPSRSDEENSSTVCISREKFNNMIDSFLEIRSYNVEPASEKRGQRNIWRYATPDVSKMIEDNSAAIMVTSFDQFCNIYNSEIIKSSTDLEVIPIVIDTPKSIILYRSILRLFGGDAYKLSTLSPEDISTYDKMAPEIALRFLRDINEQSELEKLPKYLHYSNITEESLKNGVFDFALAVLELYYLNRLGSINNTNADLIIKAVFDFMNSRR